LRWTFKHIIPHPLVDENTRDSEIWNKEFSFEENTNYNITSPSGKGKSTLLSFCCGFRKDFNGELTLNNKSILLTNKNDWSRIRSEKLAYVPQKLSLIPSLTVWENLKLKNDLTNHKTNAQINELIKAFGLEKCKNKKPHLISLGQQQRVAIIRALIQPFETLIMDEPFSHIDKANVITACDLIEQTCKKENANLIITSLNDKTIFRKIEQLYL
jgi:putative ABC transport system ATP-binding protein